MSTTTVTDTEIEALEREIYEAKARLAKMRQERSPEPVKDYELAAQDGVTVKLSELFGEKEDLILIHNMGTGCSYCTLWADGFIGLVPHLSDRAALVFFSPDAPDVQKSFAEKRGWNYRMVSGQGSTFNKDMGFETSEGSYAGPQPGVSAFKKDATGSLVRTGKASFGPGDDFCAVWPFLDLLEGGPKGWEPKYFYK